MSLNFLRAKKATKSEKSHRTRPSPLLRGLAIFVLLVGLSVIGAYGYFIGPASATIAPGVSIGPLAVSGMTQAQAITALEQATQQLQITFSLNPSSNTNNTRLSLPVNQSKSPLPISLDISATIARAMNVGHRGNALRVVAEQVESRIFGRTITPVYTFDRGAATSYLNTTFASQFTPPTDARFSIAFAADTTPTTTVIEGTPGTLLNTRAAILEMENRLETLSSDTVVLIFNKAQPKITAADIAPLTEQIPNVLQRLPLSLSVQTVTWSLDPPTAADMLTATTNGIIFRLSLDPEKLKTYLEKQTSSLSTTPVDAVFTMQNGKVTTFQPGIPGTTIDVPASLAIIESALFTPNQLTSPTTPALQLPTAQVQPTITTASSNPYGITEVIGVGATNFRGSPTNRRINIKIGAASVNGTLVQPGEEFSLLKTLGKIDATTGYLPELVIKGNRTIPEFGGGLCQIGSTTFRAVLASGLPVTARQNHSYRVPYYERDGDGKTIGPGKDATIYDPAPDFKFVNDTGSTILITTEIKGDKLSFLFWGKKDGRVAAQTDAKVSNVIPPPPTKLIETTDLPVGQKKCTEKPHPGSDATFTYTVTYPDGSLKKRDFFSRYRPWQEVCLIGVAPGTPGAVSSTAPATSPTTTPPASADTAGVAGN